MNDLHYPQIIGSVRVPRACRSARADLGPCMMPAGLAWNSGPAHPSQWVHSSPEKGDLRTSADLGRERKKPASHNSQSLLPLPSLSFSVISLFSLFCRISDDMSCCFLVDVTLLLSVVTCYVPPVPTRAALLLNRSP